MKPSKKPRRDERILVEFIRELARSPGREAEILERRAIASPWRSAWAAMYGHLPEFPERLNYGSPNIRALAGGCGVWHPQTRSAALASWRRAAAAEEAVGFMLEEPGSRIYRAWSLLGRLSAFRWALRHPEEGAKLLAYLSKWLTLYWTVEALSCVELDDGCRSLWCGARSQGAFNRLLSDYVLTRALGWHWKWHRKPHPLPDASWQKGEEVRAFDAFAREIADSAAPVRDAWQASEGGRRKLIVQSLVAAAPKWPTIAPTVFRRTSEGLAVWCENSDVNGNTPGIAAMIWRDSPPEPGAHLLAAPTPSRAHKRQAWVPQSIERHGDVLHFRQEAPGTPEEFDLALPGGEVFYEVRHGEGGLVMV